MKEENHMIISIEAKKMEKIQSLSWYKKTQQTRKGKNTGRRE